MAHEHQADENVSPGQDRRKADLRKELRGAHVLEAIMAANVIAMTIALFCGGVVTGVIAVVALAVRREDRRYSSCSARRRTGCPRVRACSTGWAAGTWTRSFLTRDLVH